MDTLTNIAIAAERFDAELLRLRATIDQILPRVRRGEDVSSDLRGLAAKANIAVAAATATTTLSQSHFDAARADA